jgi:hypothetical protein
MLPSSRTYTNYNDQSHLRHRLGDQQCSAKVSLRNPLHAWITRVPIASHSDGFHDETRLHGLQAVLLRSGAAFQRLPRRYTPRSHSPFVLWCEVHSPTSIDDPTRMRRELAVLAIPGRGGTACPKIDGQGGTLERTRVARPIKGRRHFIILLCYFSDSPFSSLQRPAAGFAAGARVAVVKLAEGVSALTCGEKSYLCGTARGIVRTRSTITMALASLRRNAKK